ncbi:MAG: triose-phosphate isomerase [Fimbriimonadaceae bacterium]
MRTKLVVGNWKMNMTTAEAAAAVETFIKRVDAKSNVDVAICPPFTAIPKVRELIKNSHIQLAAQNVFWKESGAFTGQISAPMLYELGCSYCVVGHSETRGRFGKLEISEQSLSFFNETDYTINLKIRALLYHSVNPILCVGETAEERANGQTEEIIRSQLTAALEGIDAAELYFSVVAYEPVWAIGTGETCDAAEANRVCEFIRGVLGSILDKDLAEEVRILYGGSVNALNCKELFSQPNIDGGLVGGASLDPTSFSLIVMSA